MAEEEQPITPTSTDKIVPRIIEDEMKQSYLDYAMSVIVGRALPDAKDGLKPVHRRILYAMNDMGMKHNTAFKKSARIVGEVLGKYHPHGDSAVYESMVRMAQNWSLRYMLVDGQGNFGCFTKETKVQLADGRQLSFEELIKEDNQGKKNYTYTIDEKGLIKVAPIKKPRLTREKAELMKVTLDNGEEIRCTLNHKFMLKNGTYKEAQNLQKGESLMPFYTRQATKEDTKKELVDYTLIKQPKTEEWEFAHHLADSFNIENQVYSLSTGRVRHHKDFNKHNNNPENIQRMHWKDHWLLHAALTKERHANDPEYVRKLSEGRKAFYDNEENKKKIGERLSKRNIENWQKPSYREHTIATLSRLNKKHYAKHPELKKKLSERATKTLKTLWKKTEYRAFMREKIIKGNKNHTTNKTGKKKFLTICNHVLEKTGTINGELYESYRNEVYPYGHAPTWETGRLNYFNNKGTLELVNEATENHRVLTTEILNTCEDVYDITIDGTHNFSLAAGIFVHNSIDGDNPAAMRYCITGDTLILTKKGLRPIKELSTSKKEAVINETIISFNGKQNKANKFFNSGKHPIIEIETENGNSISGSKNHPILTWTFEEKPVMRWKRLDQLKEGDITVMSRDGLFPTEKLHLKQYHPLLGKDKKITLPNTMNKELSFALGALVAEGSFHKKKILFNNKDMKYYEKVRKAILKNCKGTTLYERDIKGGCKGFEIYHQQAVKFLKNIGLKEAESHEKIIPHTILSSTKTIQRAFLQGLFEGDGSVTIRKDKRHGGQSIELCYHSKSKQLIRELKVMLLNFGINTTKPYKDKRNDCYKIQISDYDNQRQFYEDIGFYSEKKQERLAHIKKQNPYRMSKNDYIPHLALYLRDKYKKETLVKNNIDRYNLIRKNLNKLTKILDKEDRQLVATLLTRHYVFSPINKITKKKEETVYSVRVNSTCHSFVANGFINHNTEARMKRLAEEMLADIDKETVKMIDNFDGSLKEPKVLPTKVPCLLINGSSGIAVGMATNMPPHNLAEVGQAIITLIDNPEAEYQDLMKYVKGPDFPTGGIIQGNAGIINAYKYGKGRVKVRAVFEEEESKKGRKLIIKEIPYMVNKSLLITQIADGVRDKKIEGVRDLRDESDRKGMRIVIELKNDANPDVLMNQLYKHSRCQETFGINNLALVDNQPKILGLKELLEIFIEHRKDVITKRTQYDLKKAKAKAHILEGLVKALKHIDAIITLIKKSADVQTAQAQLMSTYALSEEQSKAILEMRLSRLAALEQEKIKKELAETLEIIKELQAILDDITKVLAIIKQETMEIVTKYGDARKTHIIEGGDEDDIDIEDLIDQEDMVVTISTAGYCKRLTIDTYKAQRRGGKGIKAATTKEDDALEHLFIANTHNYLLIFTDKGRVHWLKVYKIPEASRYSKGTAIINLVNMQKDEKVSAVIPVKEFDDQHFLTFITKRGTLKKTSLGAYSRPRQGGIIALNLIEGDDLIAVLKTDGKDHLLIATAKGMAVKFREGDVRSMGRASTGVRGISLGTNDKVIGMVKAPDNGILATITENGYGKKTRFDDYRLINRGGKGVRNIICSPRNGDVVNINRVEDNDDLMFITAKGIVIRTPAKDISVIGRNTQGLRLMRLSEGDKVVTAAKIVEEENSDVQETEE